MFTVWLSPLSPERGAGARRAPSSARRSTPPASRLPATCFRKAMAVRSACFGTAMAMTTGGAAAATATAAAISAEAEAEAET